MRLTAVLLFLLFLLFLSKINPVFAQVEDQNPIPVSDIKIGLVNLDHVRAILLERGFKLQSKKLEGTHLHEYWFIPNPECPTVCSLVTFQINRNTDGNMTFCSFSYSVRKNKQPEYYVAMKQDAIVNFPLKKVQEVSRTTKASGSDSEETRDDYNLIRYSNNNKITVTLEDDGNWAGCEYSLTTFSNISSVKKKPVGSSTRRK